MTVCSLSESDLSQVVQIHLAAFPSFFLSKMGPSFLRLYYNAVRKMPDGILLGCYDGSGKVIGFSAATTNCSGFNKRLLLKNILTFGLISFKLLFTNPEALIHLVANLTKRPQNGIKDSFDYGELLSIAVSPGFQRSGIGQSLIIATEQMVSKSGQFELSLTTDAKDNEKAVSFYKKNGYAILYEFTAYPNRIMFRMNKRIH